MATTGNATFSPVGSTVHGSWAPPLLLRRGLPAAFPSFLLLLVRVPRTWPCASCPRCRGSHATSTGCDGRVSDTSRCSLRGAASCLCVPRCPPVWHRDRLSLSSCTASMVGRVPSDIQALSVRDSPSDLRSAQLVLVSLTSKCWGSPGLCQPLRLAPPTTHGLAWAFWNVPSSLPPIPHQGANPAWVPSCSSNTDSSWKICAPSAPPDLCCQRISTRHVLSELLNGCLLPPGWDLCALRPRSWHRGGGPDQWWAPRPQGLLWPARGAVPHGAGCAWGCHRRWPTLRLFRSSRRLASVLTYFVRRRG